MVRVGSGGGARGPDLDRWSLPPPPPPGPCFLDTMKYAPSGTHCLSHVSPSPRAKGNGRGLNSLRLWDQPSLSNHQLLVSVFNHSSERPTTDLEISNHRWFLCICVHRTGLYGSLVAGDRSLAQSDMILYYLWIRAYYLCLDEIVTPCSLGMSYCFNLQPSDAGGRGAFLPFTSTVSPLLHGGLHFSPGNSNLVQLVQFR